MTSQIILKLVDTPPPNGKLILLFPVITKSFTPYERHSQFDTKIGIKMKWRTSTHFLLVCSTQANPPPPKNVHKYNGTVAS